MLFYKFTQEKKLILSSSHPVFQVILIGKKFSRGDKNFVDNEIFCITWSSVLHYVSIIVLMKKILFVYLQKDVASSYKEQMYEARIESF